MNKRLESLDILRGLDLFLLTCLGPIIYTFLKTGDYSFYEPVHRQISHVAWQGYVLWDQIMPLFMFMSGVTIPFSMRKYRDQFLAGDTKAGSKVYWRIVRRVASLWILGMIVQGQLLDLNPQVIRFFSNTLQAIAVGYLFTALAFLHTRPRTQYIIAAGLLLLYWALMMFVRVGEYGGGDFTRDYNLCEYVDRVVLGRFRDAASIGDDGSVVFSERYRYTWILSSLNFVVTVMTGMFAGRYLRDGKDGGDRKALVLLGSGAAMVALGWLWNLQMPVIKTIWTSSMVLVSSGYSFILLAIVYWIVDVKQKGGWLKWLKIYGMNSILAYMLYEVISWKSVAKSIFHGLEQYMSAPWYAFVLGVVGLAINAAILYYFYKKKIYLRV